MALFLSGLVSPVTPGSSTELTLSRSTLVTDANITDAYWSVTSNWGNVVVMYIDATDMQIKPLVFMSGIDTAYFSPSSTARQNTWVLHSVIVQDNDGGDYPIPSSEIANIADYDVVVFSGFEAVYAPNHGSSSVAIFVVNEGTGQLVPASPTTISTDVDPNSVTVLLGGQFAYVPCSGPSVIDMFSINQSNGNLTALSPPSISVGSNPNRVVFTPNGDYAYASADNNVWMYSVDQITGQLTALSPSTIATGSDGSFYMAMHPSGNYAYCVNNASGINNISMYSINTGNGQLTSLGTIATGNNPRNMVINSLGTYAYVANIDDNTVSMYSINTGTGILTALGTPTIATGGDPSTVMLNPAGTFAYVANFSDDTIGMYSVNQGSGELLALSPATIACAGGPVAMSLNAGGTYMFVTGLTSGNVSMFSVADNGQLTALSPATVSSSGSSPYLLTIATIV